MRRMAGSVVPPCPDSHDRFSAVYACSERRGWLGKCLDTPVGAATVPAAAGERGIPVISSPVKWVLTSVDSLQRPYNCEVVGLT